MIKLLYRVKAAGGWLRTVRKVVHILRREGLSGLRRRLALAMGFSSWNYSGWIRRYDTLTDETRAKMRQVADGFARKPLISVVMPCYNPKPEWLKEAVEKVLLDVPGYCPTCQKNVRFISTNSWLRDHLLCQNCGSIPRERALLVVLEMCFPNWRNLIIHESSPVNRGASIRIARDCSQYISSQLFGDMQSGDVNNGVRCENLEHLTFPNESIDLHITQDVMEHVFNPYAAFSEIARTLRPGGAHVFTAPLVNKAKPSERAAIRNGDGTITHLLCAEYHGNPIDPRGSLVVFRWGFDIAQHIFESSGLFTEFHVIDDLSQGIRAEYIEVMVSRKCRRP